MWVKARSLFRTRERSRGRDLPAVMMEREMQPARVTHAGAADAIGAGTIVVRTSRVRLGHLASRITVTRLTNWLDHGHDITFRLSP